MWFLDQIVSWFNSVTGWFLSAFYTVNGWIWPFNLLATPLYWLYYAFFYVTWFFGQFNVWLDWAAGRIDAILSSWDIGQLFKWWFDAAANAWNWVLNATYNIRSFVDSWWQGVSTTVHGWIDTAVQGFSDLRAAWNNFWNVTLPQLVSFNWLTTWWNSTFYNIQAWVNSIIPNIQAWWDSIFNDIQGLINSAFLTREGFWKGWQEVRDNVVGFITAPLDFLLDKFTDWFLGKE